MRRTKITKITWYLGMIFHERDINNSSIVAQINHSSFSEIIFHDVNNSL